MNIAALGRSINSPGGLDLVCKLKPGKVEYFQLSLFDDDLGLLKTPPSEGVILGKPQDVDRPNVAKRS
ncbi:MAG: hypothetical protein AAF383_31205 [Cyanobacteria bacterium P01_A01_bin.83]